MSAQGLPAHILALFTPRPPPQHLPPCVVKPLIKTSGCAEYVEFFSTDPPPPREPWESPLERKARRHREKVQAHKAAQKKIIDTYDPHKDANASGDPFKTLFVGRISYDTTEKKLKREFEVFGSIKKVRMVYDQKGKPRGYAFIEFEHERDLKNAYKQGDGKKIDGRRVMVDVERGRTVEGWLPRRLGGGRGPGRQGKPSKKKQRRLAETTEKLKEKEKEEKADKKKDKEKDKDKEDDDKKDKKGRDKEKEKEKEREREKEKDKKKDKEKERKRERSRSRDRDRKK
ncbi:RNU1 [Symbiodinium sp. CCMP2592]|nr:RNU1 [Symbiodinium sp. CCMP2592]|mmetsp:Transcript_149377/g.212398  ORF Transcript_149377/g.212398 Transcript_149377/m.212398 type:complete len:286 (-) Transcript_149377:133-990(-)